MIRGPGGRATTALSLILIATSAGCSRLPQITPEPEDQVVPESSPETQWGEPTDGWRLSLALDHTTYAHDAPIVATIRFQNVSGHEQRLGGDGRDFDHDLDCTTADGRRVPLTSYGKLMVENRGLGKATGGVLPPQGQTVVQLAISRHLDLSLPGRYRLVVSRQVFANEDPNAPRVVSNAVEFVRQE